MKTQALFTFRVLIGVKKEEDAYVSWCPALDISSAGDSEEEARKNIIQAIRLFLTTCYEDGTLDQVLKNCGFIPIKGKPRALRPTGSQQEVDVPLPFMINQAQARCQG